MVDVPKEPKVYTTVYDNFKGVDYTDDASNVFRRRSPDGLNMLPDLDGKPYKRTGWKIEVPKEAFTAIDYTTVDVIADTSKQTLASTWLYIAKSSEHGVCVCPACIDGSGTQPDGTPCPYVYNETHMTPHEIQDFDIEEMREDPSAMSQYQKNAITPWWTINEITPATDIVYRLAIGTNGYDAGTTFLWNGSAYQVTTPPSDTPSEIVTERLHHFSIGGTEYIMIFNNAGVYTMTSADGVQRCQYKDIAENVSDFPPLVASTSGQAVTADANRAFYFEGNGIAGFYVFVGNRLFRFDGDYFVDVEPYVPIVIDGASPATGAGTDGESVNMLTEKRTVSYVATGDTHYVLPETPKQGTVTAKLKDQFGKFDTDISIASVTNNTVTFTSAPPASTDQQDNVRITYEPGGSGTLYSVQTIETAAITLKSTYVEKRSRTKTVTKKHYIGKSTSYIDSETTAISNWSAYAKSSESNSSAEIKLPNNYNQAETVISDNANGTWRNNQSYIKRTFAPYAASVTVAPTSSVATSYGTATTSDTGWVKRSTKTSTSGSWKTTKTVYEQVQTRTRTKSFSVKASYPKYETMGATEGVNYDSRNAFMSCRKAINYGNNVYNQVFLSSATQKGFETRAWYCDKNDPSYWGDLNYIEVGSDDTEIVGMSKVGNYVGFMKAGTGTDSSVYFAYPTVFNDISTFAVRQGVNGIGAISPGAFNILNGEPLFLSKEGVIGIEVSEEETDRKARNRSWFINKKLLAEVGLQNAVSYIHNGMYYLAINNHCYVLDGAQKNSWMNEKTNLQYECYYLENVPATCFAGMDGDLYFSDDLGNICRFKRPDEDHVYRDGYDGEKPILDYDSLDIYTDGVKDLNKMKAYIGSQVNATTGNYIAGVDEGLKTFILEEGVPIPARWSTIADDDGAVHFFKNLQKKGTVISLMPASNTGVDVYLKPDEKEPILVGKTDMQDHVLPFEYYTKKKIKKYKRLQIICENNELDDAFGIDQIIKSYTMGNYSKNRK